MPNRQGLTRFGYVVHPQDLDPLLNRKQQSGERARYAPISGFITAQPGNHRFARYAEHDGAAEGMKRADPGEEFEIVRHELAEPDARVDRDTLSRDPGGRASLDARFQKLQYLDER